MRWIWLALALCAGCGGSVSSDPSDKSVKEDQSEKPDPAGMGWVIRGTADEQLLLTNGEFGVWISTASGLRPANAFLIRDGAVHKIPNAEGPHIQMFLRAVGPEELANDALRDGETLNWSFDLRTGELRSVRRFANERIEFTAVMDPEKPLVAINFDAVPEAISVNRGGAEVRIGPVTTLIAEEDFGVDLQVARSPNYLGIYPRESPIPGGVQYDEILAKSKELHEESWKTDIEIDGPAEDQLAIRTMLHYLRRGASGKLPPFGASNAKYRGARFWDAEAWILPVLAVVDGQMAEAATKWRIHNLGDRIPWEAAVGGKDVTPKEFGNALHVAGWVAWWTNRAKLLGLATEADEKKVLEVAFSQYYKAASDTGHGMEIKDVESPDEGRLRDNDLVTNLLAKRVARWAADHGIADGEDLEWFNSIKTPRAQNGLPATYDNDLLKGYQQTAALLAIYPLEENFGKGVAEKMFDRYADLTSEVGPAMSESVHATIAARLARPDAYKRWRKSWQTYTDDAMMFHERRNKEDAYFMTGAAGCLQTVLYGFAGMNIEKEGIAAEASKSLGNGYQVAFRPHLPAEWKSLVLRNIFLGPTRATVRITHSGVTIE